MIFRDNITLATPSSSAYRTAKLAAERHGAKCVIEQTSGLTRGGAATALRQAMLERTCRDGYHQLATRSGCRGDVVGVAGVPRRQRQLVERLLPVVQ